MLQPRLGADKETNIKKKKKILELRIFIKEENEAKLSPGKSVIQSHMTKKKRWGGNKTCQPSIPLDTFLSLCCKFTTKKCCDYCDSP